MDAYEHNRNPATVHLTEQIWAQTDEALQKILDYVSDIQPDIYRIAGNTDASVFFDFMKGYIMSAEQEHGEQAHSATILMCAAAFTRLVRTERTEASSVLAKLEEEISKHDDH